MATINRTGLHGAGLRPLSRPAERTLHRYLGLVLILLAWGSALPGETICSSLRTVEIPSGRIDMVYSEELHFEAPNWSRDGRYFIVNSGGRLYRLPADGSGGLVEIPTGFATQINNDHGISPDGELLVFSHAAEEHIEDPAQAWLASSVFILPIEGGSTPRKVTSRAPSFWHGWSPDGSTLLYTARRDDEWDVYAIPVGGGEELRLTTCSGLDDGAEYSHDGAVIYYNSFCSGSMEIWRMLPDGRGARPVTDDAFSNWFPHPSPDGQWVVFLTYLEDQGEAHPFGQQVRLRLLETFGDNVRDLTPPFFGGQGTLNVPSWSPDSRRVAFVAYEQLQPGASCASRVEPRPEDPSPASEEAKPALVRLSYPSLDGPERDALVYLPTTYDQEPARRWPVLLFLHGDGERGDGRSDLDWVLVHGPLYEAWVQKRDLPFVIVAPQLPLFGRDETVGYIRDRNPSSIPRRLTEGAPPRPEEFPTPNPMTGAVAAVDLPLGAEGLPDGWPRHERELLTLLEKVLSRFRTDPSRVYLTGLSYGGFGTWWMASRHPDRFAAIAPVAGWGHPDLMPPLAQRNLPVWAFAGGRDPVVRSEHFFAGLNRLEELGHEDVRFTVHEDRGHDVWRRVYAGEDLYQWLLSH